MIKSVTSVKLHGRRVILRAGFDVPIEDAKVMDDARIRDILPTLNYLIREKAKIVVISHLGRPEGWDQEKSLHPVAEQLAKLISYKFKEVLEKLDKDSAPHIYFLGEDITKQDFSSLSQDLHPGDILFLENMRFYPGEEKNDEEFVKVLSLFGDVYVNEAFSVAHRKEASTYGIAKALPRYAGISFVKEIQSLNKVLNHPRQPFIVLMGGAKIEGKVETIHNLAKHAKHILIGGALADSFLVAHGYEIGKSKVADVPIARDLLRNYKSKIILPVDVVVAESKDGRPKVVPIEKIGPNDIVFDIGPKTIQLFSKHIKAAETLVWNGPMGLFEEKKFATGSKAMALVFASRAKGQAFGVVGGGETGEVIDQAKVGEFIDHVSTGGGAMLEFLAGKQLPAIKALEHA
jgi:phosphoglycerate kinase